MRYFLHTEGKTWFMATFVVAWLVTATYLTRWFAAHPVCCSATTIAMLLLLRFISAGPSAKYFPENAKSPSDFAGRPLAARPWYGKVAVITGANRNLGFENAKAVALLGAHVIMVDFEPAEMAQTAIAQIKKEDEHASVHSHWMDISDLAKIGEGAKSIVEKAKALRGRGRGGGGGGATTTSSVKCIDFLVNNAGRAGVPDRTITKEGFEIVFQTNYVGAFVLTEWLLPHIADHGRIVNLASCAHTWFDVPPYSVDPQVRILRCFTELNNAAVKPAPGLTGYTLSKFGLLLYACTLAARDDLKKRNIVCASCHPGAVWTDLWRFIPYPARYLADGFFFLTFKRPVEGSQTTLHCLTAGHIASGGYYADCAQFRPRDEARDERNWKVLDDWSRKVTEKYLPTK